MIERCGNPKARGFQNYGGRGIKVCQRWRKSFVDFLADVGRRPSSRHSIDRWPNNDGNYEPSNVRWATRKEQQRNRRSNRRLTVGRVTRTVAEWAETTGVNYTTIHERLRAGWISRKAVYGKAAS